MSLKKINEELLKIGRITSGWNTAAGISDIERELVLDKLKNIYEQVIFFQREEAPQEILSEAALGPLPETGPVGEHDMFDGFDPGEAASSEEEAIPVPESGEGGAALIETLAEEALTEGAEAPVGEEVLIDLTEPSGLSGVNSESEASVAENQKEDELLKEAADQPLFDMDEIAVKRRIDHRVILSLYGDGERTAASATAGKAPESKIVPQEESAGAAVREKIVFEIEEKMDETVFSGGDSVVEEIDISEKLSRTVTAEGHAPVLGEVIGAGQTLGDALARGSVHNDVAFRVAAGQTEALRHSIGINDKFLMIRDLFSGNVQAYDRAIAALDEFTDLDEALIWMSENYRWSPDSEGVKLLVDLLTRKLS